VDDWRCCKGEPCDFVGNVPVNFPILAVGDAQANLDRHWRSWRAASCKDAAQKSTFRGSTAFFSAG
jgi:hypothetical protein